MKIRDLKPRSQVDKLTFKVVDFGEERRTASGNRVVEAIVGDETGTVKMTLWNSEINSLEKGRTYTLESGYVTLYRGSMRLTIGRFGELRESDEEINEVNLDNDMSSKTYKDERRFGRGFRRRF